MRLLLDTHTFLWFIGGDTALSPYARQLIEDPTNERFLSIASLWEMAIKVSLGRLTRNPFWMLQPDRIGWLVRKERLPRLRGNSCCRCTRHTIVAN